MKRIAFLFASMVLASGVQAQEMLPDDLQGDWGEAHQCAAQEAVGADETVSHVTDAPYRFQGQWISRWYIYCLVMQVDPMRGGYRVRALCGEDAIERPWEIDVISDGDTLSMTWFALGEENSASRPWRSGPYERCDAPQS